tara:strand:+ start:83 stop:829 length:747 start_codon:yes stop_codon:yes gene_type:complete
MSKVTAGIIIIGDEILSGRTLDINSNFIAKHLIKNGIKLNKVIIIPDNVKIIIKTVRDFHKRYTYVFTTGGIGPTHDDITSESVAKAFNKKYIINAKAFKILKKYYPKGKFNEGRLKMTMIPANSQLILNPLTGAPGFKLKNVYVLPGVPQIMQKMFISIIPKLKKSKPKKILTIKTNLFESIISKKLSLIQRQNIDYEIGSYPNFSHKNKTSGVNIVISSWKKDNLSLVGDQIIDMISVLGGKSSIV